MPKKLQVLLVLDMYMHKVPQILIIFMLNSAIYQAQQNLSFVGLNLCCRCYLQGQVAYCMWRKVVKKVLQLVAENHLKVRMQDKKEAQGWVMNMTVTIGDCGHNYVVSIPVYEDELDG